jgi:cytochrome c oxidase accessory protein FixG
LLDENSLVISYDHKRGEPRARYKRNEERKAGDCIDCHACVDVCPTGIDIRNGQQLECVNCTACIDACDATMDKVELPRGLVRYASESNIEKETKFRFTPRIISYTILLTVLVALITVLLINRTDVEVNIMRTPGMLYQDQPDNKISNLYNFHIINKTFDDIVVEFKLLNKNGKLVVLGDSLSVPEQEVYEGRFMVVLSKDSINTVKFPIRVGVYQGGEEIDVIRSTFLSHIKPEKRSRRERR